jgi:hypothetical protein
MAGVTLERAEAQLALYLQCEKDILERGQSYGLKGRQLTRANLAEIREGISYWQGMVERLDRSGGIQRRRIVNG